VNIFTAQAQFLQATGKVVAGEQEAPEDQIILSRDLVDEEYAEWFAEDFREDTTAAVKEAIDLMYVTAQYLNSVIGPNKATRCLEAVHENNMSKTKNAVLRDDGKVLKGKGYKRVDLSEIIFDS